MGRKGRISSPVSPTSGIVPPLFSSTGAALEMKHCLPAAPRLCFGCLSGRRTTPLKIQVVLLPRLAVSSRLHGTRIRPAKPPGPLVLHRCRGPRAALPSRRAQSSLTVAKTSTPAPHRVLRVLCIPVFLATLECLWQKADVPSILTLRLLIRPETARNRLGKIRRNHSPASTSQIRRPSRRTPPPAA